MKDLNEIEETEMPVEVRKDSINDAPESVLTKRPKVVRKKTTEKTKIKSEPLPLSQTTPADTENKEIQETGTVNDSKPVSKKEEKAEPMIQNVLLNESNEKPVSDKKGKKDIKKKVKKAEEKVDKLKKKVKKAKKKDLKKSKIKELKEKLEKALEKFKNKIEKLKEVKK